MHPSCEQPDCFGLRFVNKKLQFRWIELDKPLKKQLDKRADSSLLYFGVMFYIPNAHRIEDEMTRYGLTISTYHVSSVQGVRQFFLKIFRSY